MAFIFKKLEIPGLVLIETKAFGDERGYFLESYKQSEFEAAGIAENFSQDNFSFSKQNVLRGLHYQTMPHAQGKLVRVLAGKIWDVAVDMRKNSKTFGKWASAELSEENYLAFYIPAGFAHGFVVLSSEARVLYKVSQEYAPQSERGVIWNDPDLRITWPVKNPILTPKDAAFPKFKDAEIFN